MRCNNCFEEYDEDLGVCPYCGYTEGQPPKELYELNICPHCGYVENSMPEEAIHMIPGTILHGQYIVGKVVGYGGFGVTYIA